MAREPIRIAAENRARIAEAPPAPPSPPVPALDLTLSPEPEPPKADLDLDAFDLSLSAPLELSSEADEPKTGEAFDIFAAALRGTKASDPAPPIAFEPSTPDPQVAAILTRLERFLGAIETARSA
jgi:hypothetical protein